MKMKNPMAYLGSCEHMILENPNEKILCPTCKSSLEFY